MVDLHIRKGFIYLHIIIDGLVSAVITIKSGNILIPDLLLSCKAYDKINKLYNEEHKLKDGLIKVTRLKEEHRAIKNYEGRYDMSASGKVFSYSHNRYLARKQDEYGFHIVKLSKAGVPTNCNVFGLWKDTFPELSESEFKGTKTIKYR